MTALFLGFGCPLLISLLLTWALIRGAPRLGLIDHPDPRKVHQRPTPRGGGLAIYAGFAFTAVFLPLLPDPLSLPLSATARNHLLLGSLIVLLGLVDDLRPLPWMFRLGVQLGVALVALWLIPGLSGVWLTIVALLWVGGLTNAFNMLDNMDGLSAGVAWLSAGFFAFAIGLLQHQGQPIPTSGALPFLMLMGALTGFLWFNHPSRARPAPIFMGDAGSTFLGFFLGLAGVEAATRAGSPPWAWAIPLALCAVPCYDLLSVVALRLRQGRSPFHADKQHLSHRLVARGLSPPAAVRLIYLLALASGAGGLLLYDVKSGTGAALLGVVLAGWWLALAVLEYLLQQASQQREAPTEKLPLNRPQ
jgi:UDP-GlcNAc:undecaprenyl-phosphate GlcNAc-1-phosphate transferase